MQLGLVGLGKMGFNMRERLREGGHEVIGYDPRPEVTDVPTLAALAEALTAPRVVWVMVPSGPVTHETIAALADELGRGRPGDRRRKLALHRRRSARKTVGRQGHRVHRRRCLRRHLGSDGRLRPDGRRQRRRRRAGDADLRRAASARRTGRRIRARRPGRRGPLREDGAQRCRVRADDGLRRGLRDAGRRGSDQETRRPSTRRGPTAPWCGPGCSSCWPRR